MNGGLPVTAQSPGAVDARGSAPGSPPAALVAPRLATPGDARLSQPALDVGAFVPSQRNTFSLGTVQGAVLALDFDAGAVTLTNDGGAITLRARPTDIQGLNPGDIVALQFSNYDGVVWLVPTSTPFSTAAFSIAGTLTGPVSFVDKADGVLTIGGYALRAHPEDLQAVLPGQFLSVGYANVSGQSWVSSLGVR